MLPNAKLDQFFSEVDTNHDGVITFDEWRYTISAFMYFLRVSLI